MKKEIQLSDHFTYTRLLRFAFSPIMMMVFTSIYGVVDGLFVSNFVGKVPFAAINLIMPFTMVLGGLGFMIGTGGSALTAKTLGEGRREDAERYFTMMVLFTLIVGGLATVFGIAFMEPAARLLGATDAMMEDCVTYGRIVVGFTTAFMLQNVFQTFLSTAEKPKLGLLYTIAAGVANMVLDALFIGVFRWGVAGAALATGLSQCGGGVLPLFYFLRPNTSLLRLRKTRLEARVLLRACANGSSELMSNISGSLVGMLYNFQLLRFAGEDLPAIKSFDQEGVVMYAGSFSKVVSPGMRVGYAIGPKELIQKMVVCKQGEDVHSNIWAQIVCHQFMTGCDYEAHIQRLRDIYRRKSGVLLKAMEEHFAPLITWNSFEGGLFAWCVLPDGIDMLDFVKRGAERKVCVVPGTAFLTDESQPCQAFRVNFSTPTDEQLREGVKILGQLAKEMAG